MNKVLSWIESEPVATRVGPMVVLVVGFLLTRGAVDKDTADLVLGIIAAIFGITGVASARSAVTPTAALSQGKHAASDEA